MSELKKYALLKKAQFKGFAFTSVDDFLTPENRGTWARSWEASLHRQVAVVAEYEQVVAQVEGVLTEFLA